MSAVDLLERRIPNRMLVVTAPAVGAAVVLAAIWRGSVGALLWSAAGAAGLFVDAAPGPALANSGLENLRFVTPVSPGDSIRVELTAKQITPRETDDYGEVRWDAVLRNQRDDLVASYDVLTLVAKEREAAA